MSPTAHLFCVPKFLLCCASQLKNPPRGFFNEALDTFQHYYSCPAFPYGRPLSIPNLAFHFYPRISFVK